MRILVWGAGSQALIYINLVKQLYPDSELAIFDPTNVFNDKGVFSLKLIRKRSQLLERMSSFSHFLVAIGNDFGLQRVKIGRYLETFNLHSLSLIHPSAYIGNYVTIGKGVVVLARAVVVDFTSLGDYSIVNTSATIDHEGSIGEGAHVMGGASLAGRVSVGCYSSIGTNATVLPDLCVGERVFLGAGAVLTKDTKSNELWIGVPARKEKAYHVKDDGIFPDP